jgi:phage baseplate assembly protein W
MAEVDVQIGRVRQYRDISLSMSKNPITGDILAVSGGDAVKRAVKNILMTNVGEVPFFPEFGSRIRHLLFEPIDPMTTTLLANEIRASVEAYEPRITITRLVLTPMEDDNAYQVDMEFQIVNQIQPVTLTLFLSRVR